MFSFHYWSLPLCGLAPWGSASPSPLPVSFWSWLVHHVHSGAGLASAWPPTPRTSTTRTSCLSRLWISPEPASKLLEKPHATCRAYSSSTLSITLLVNLHASDTLSSMSNSHRSTLSILTLVSSILLRPGFEADWSCTAEARVLDSRMVTFVPVGIIPMPREILAAYSVAEPRPVIDRPIVATIVAVPPGLALLVYSRCNISRFSTTSLRAIFSSVKGVVII